MGRGFGAVRVLHRGGIGRVTSSATGRRGVRALAFSILIAILISILVVPLHRFG